MALSRPSCCTQLSRDGSRESSLNPAIIVPTRPWVFPLPYAQTLYLIMTCDDLWPTVRDAGTLVPQFYTISTQFPHFYTTRPMSSSRHLLRWTLPNHVGRFRRHWRHYLPQSHRAARKRGICNVPELSKSCGCRWSLRACWPASARADSPTESIDLSPRIEPNALTRVTIDLDAGGNDLVRAVDRRQGRRSHRWRRAEAADERLGQIAIRRAAAGRRARRRGDHSPIPLAIRYYDRAEGVLKVDTSGLAPKLSDDRRLIVVESGAVRPSLYSPDGPLPREQLDLIDVVGQFVPDRPVAADQPRRQG